MPSILTASAIAHISKPVLRYAKLFEIVRTDGVVMRFADHDVPIVFDGHTYIPAMFGSSATDQTSGFESNNLELRGALDSQAIKEEEIRAGLYRNSTLTIYVVDWMYPFTGFIRREKYLIESTRWTGQLFEAQLSGLTSRLLKPVGRVISRDCDVEKLGDARCTVNIQEFKVEATVTTVVEERRVFEIGSIVPGAGYAGAFANFDNDGLFDFGEVVWATGMNTGFSGDVKSSVSSSGRVEMQIRTPRQIAVGDTLSITPGCRRVREDCMGTAIGDGASGRRKPWPNNIENYRGYPDMPGTVIVLKSPSSQQ